MVKFEAIFHSSAFSITFKFLAQKKCFLTVRLNMLENFLPKNQIKVLIT